MAPLVHLVRRLALLAVTVALLAACGSGVSRSGGSTPAPNPSPTPTPSPTFGLNQRVTVSGLQFPTALPQPTPLQTVAAFPNISFSEPVFITHAGDGGNRLFVVEKAGTIRVFANNAAVANSGVFLNISAQVLSDGEQGLLGLAFDPDYATNGFFYVYYSVG
ncbi:MAG: hypothetical protein A2W18_11435 [Candidatus Muproteobacteria bacterium RBG_16_60_9]|uniref:Glucose/Sorbosone dehydrogenase domain-containing protein n=1 Tax=Candidatus Muproteobacteria bacterium RBG_16_60_9 TaxID=1817755 RepID=A0A1F6V341_9PROT|nr:MAG: hypothetical protein A2W18_11435 [Candidatus Muproteobacteria bacterium RBG_16_60_9]